MITLEDHEYETISNRILHLEQRDKQQSALISLLETRLRNDHPPSVAEEVIAEYRRDVGME